MIAPNPHEMNPIPVAAHSPTLGQEVAISHDFFDSELMERKRPWQRRRIANLFEPLFDARIAGRLRSVRQLSAALPVRRVLLSTVAVPSRAAEFERVLAEFRNTRHQVTTCVAQMGDRGKFENINIALADHAVETFDWLIVTDDDVRLPPQFLDDFLFLAEAMKLKIAQPAHRCLSYTTFTFNYRKWNSLARITRYVESGPITAFHRDTFPFVLPFPPLRWAWGTDIAWSEAAERHGMAIGIVDCTPIKHLKAVASGYHVAPAIAEARDYLTSLGIRHTRKSMFVDVRVIRSLAELTSQQITAMPNLLGTDEAALKGRSPD